MALKIRCYKYLLTINKYNSNNITLIEKIYFSDKLLKYKIVTYDRYWFVFHIILFRISMTASMTTKLI
jgi:hypothetical protein